MSNRVTLQAAPYDIRFFILSNLWSLHDLHNLQRTCKALHEPMLMHSTSIHTAIASRHFADIGWSELLRLLRAKQFARNTENIQHLAELPFAVSDGLTDDRTMDSTVYTPPEALITTADFKELMMLEKLIRSIAGLVATRDFRTVSNVLLLDVIPNQTETLTASATRESESHTGKLSKCLERYLNGDYFLSMKLELHIYRLISNAAEWKTNDALEELLCEEKVKATKEMLWQLLWFTSRMY